MQDNVLEKQEVLMSLFHSVEKLFLEGIKLKTCYFYVGLYFYQG